MRTRLVIDGMLSVQAARAIELALTPVQGIARVETTLGRIVVEHDGRATCDHLRAAIGTAGFVVRECTEDGRSLPTLG